MGASLHRTGIEIFDGKILNKNQLFETASPSPFVMEHITETTKSAITIRDGEENDRYTVTLKFKKKTLENNDLVDKETDEHINSKETNDDNSEMVLLSPNPVETELNIRITDPELENCSYTIRNASGVTIKKGTITSENIRINMRKHPQGHYILIIEKNGDTYPFKIEKIK